MIDVNAFEYLASPIPRRDDSDHRWSINWRVVSPPLWGCWNLPSKSLVLGKCPHWHYCFSFKHKRKQGSRLGERQWLMQNPKERGTSRGEEEKKTSVPYLIHWPIFSYCWQRGWIEFVDIQWSVLPVFIFEILGLTRLLFYLLQFGIPN